MTGAEALRHHRDHPFHQLAVSVWDDLEAVGLPVSEADAPRGAGSHRGGVSLSLGGTEPAVVLDTATALIASSQVRPGLAAPVGWRVRQFLRVVAVLERPANEQLSGSRG
ncbi:hypothetical protein ABZ746_34295 [Streptomyces sp. NPDC020096]